MTVSLAHTCLSSSSSIPPSFVLGFFSRTFHTCLPSLPFLPPSLARFVVAFSRHPHMHAYTHSLTHYYLHSFIVFPRFLALLLLWHFLPFALLSLTKGIGTTHTLSVLPSLPPSNEKYVFFLSSSFSSLFLLFSSLLLLLLLLLVMLLVVRRLLYYRRRPPRR